jgi:hypothetical protein
MQIPANQHNLATKNGYFNRYFQLLPHYSSGLETYIALEAEYYEKYKRSKYKNYETFRASKSIYFGKHY